MRFALFLIPALLAAQSKITVTVPQNRASTGRVIFNDTALTPNTVTLRAPNTVTTSYEVVWPAAAAAGCLQRDGAGVVTWGACGGSTSTLDATVTIQTGSLAHLLDLRAAYASGGTTPLTTFLTSRGTLASPTAVQATDPLGGFGFNGYSATGFVGNISAMVNAYAAENFTDTAKGSYLQFEATPNGTATRKKRLVINGTGNLVEVFGEVDGVSTSQFSVDSNGTVAAKNGDFYRTGETDSRVKTQVLQIASNEGTDVSWKLETYVTPAASFLQLWDNDPTNDPPFLKAWRKSASSYTSQLELFADLIPNSTDRLSGTMLRNIGSRSRPWNDGYFNYLETGTAASLIPSNWTTDTLGNGGSPWNAYLNNVTIYGTCTGCSGTTSEYITETYAWTRPGGVSVTGGSTYTLDITECPYGVTGTDTTHPVWLSAGTGTAERVFLQGGTCTPGATSGTLIITPANSHSGAWTIGTATDGAQEAHNATGLNTGGTIKFKPGLHVVHAQTTITHDGITVEGSTGNYLGNSGPGVGTKIQVAAGANLDAVFKVTNTATFSANGHQASFRNLQIDGNRGTWTGTNWTNQTSGLGHGIWIHNADTTWTQARAMELSEITGVSVESVRGVGILVDSAGGFNEAGLISHTLIRGSGQENLKITGGDWSIINSNGGGSGNGKPCVALEGNRPEMIGGIWDYCDGAGIDLVFQDSTYTWGPLRASLTSVRVERSQKAGLYLHGYVADVSVIGGQYNNNGVDGAAHGGIEIYGDPALTMGVKGIVIDGVRSWNSAGDTATQTYGVWIHSNVSGGSITLSGNDFTGNTSSPIKNDSAVTVEVRGNAGSSDIIRTKLGIGIDPAYPIHISGGTAGNIFTDTYYGAYGDGAGVNADYASGLHFRRARGTSPSVAYLTHAQDRLGIIAGWGKVLDYSGAEVWDPAAKIQIRATAVASGTVGIPGGVVQGSIALETTDATGASVARLTADSTGVTIPILNVTTCNGCAGSGLMTTNSDQTGITGQKTWSRSLPSDAIISVENTGDGGTALTAKLTGTTGGYALLAQANSAGGYGLWATNTHAAGKGVLISTASSQTALQVSNTGSLGGNGYSLYVTGPGGSYFGGDVGITGTLTASTSVTSTNLDFTGTLTHNGAGALDGGYSCTNGISAVTLMHGLISNITCKP